jgi:2-keto-4-pentenoate hydratase
VKKVRLDAAAMTVKQAAPSHEQIEQLARTYWAGRGYEDGQAEQDWLRAEQELLHKRS